MTGVGKGSGCVRFNSSRVSRVSRVKYSIMYVDYFSRVSNSDEREGREREGEGKGKGEGGRRSLVGGLGGWGIDRTCTE
jgi:hypothetical protein